MPRREGGPVIVWNQAFEFLANIQDPAPAGWSIVEEDDLDGQSYFRRPSEDPQNFAVRIGDTWAASMATKQTTDSFLVGVFRDNLPGPLKQVFPYRLLLQPSETQIGGLLHESFHVYQYQMAPARMAEAESIHRLGEEYEARPRPSDRIGSRRAPSWQRHCKPEPRPRNASWYANSSRLGRHVERALRSMTGWSIMSAGWNGARRLGAAARAAACDPRGYHDGLGVVECLYGEVCGHD